jgi:hypothetical protein
MISVRRPILLIVTTLSCAFAQSKTFTLDGRVVDKFSKERLENINVQVVGTTMGDVTDTSGYYRIDHIKPGTHTIQYTRIGYKTVYRKVSFAKNIYLAVEMEEESLIFDPIEITPGIVELTSDGGPTATVGAQEINNTATIFSKDVYRSLQVLPGVSNSEWSSKPYIKGGNPDETAILIDNYEILEPFHLEEIDGPFSVISADLVKDMRLITGGFAPKYADKMSGILRVKTIDRVDNDFIKGSLDFMNASLGLHQRIGNRVTNFFSGRRSYTYFIEQATDLSFPSVVYDIWNKLDYKIDPRNTLSFNFMYISDKVGYKQDSTLLRNEFFDSNKRNYYTWLNWSRSISENRFFTTMAGYQNLQKKSDFAFDGSFTEDNRDRRFTELATLRQDHYWKIDRHAVEFGAEFNYFNSDYFYREFRLNPTETTDIAVSTDILFVDTRFDGYTGAGYIQDTYEFNDRMNVMLGARISMQDYSDRWQFAPRAAISYQFSDKITTKLAYGWYYQPDAFQKMRTYQNQSRLEANPEKSIHYVGSLIYSHDNDAQMTLDVYLKDYRRLNDDFRFDFFNRIEGVGIVDKPFHTRNGYAAGLDLFMRKRYLKNNLFSVAYSLSYSRINDYLGETTPRDLDRTFSVTLNNIWNFKNNVTFSTIWRYHTGDPFTSSIVRLVGDSTVENSRVFYITETKNGRRLPAFHSLDLKLEKKWILDSWFIITYINVINALDHKNIRQYAWKRVIENDRLVGFTRDEQTFFPRFISAGFTLEFDIPLTNSVH